MYSPACQAAPEPDVSDAPEAGRVLLLLLINSAISITVTITITTNYYYYYYYYWYKPETNESETGRWLLTEEHIVRDVIVWCSFMLDILRFGLQAQIRSRILRAIFRPPHETAVDTVK